MNHRPRILRCILIALAIMLAVTIAAGCLFRGPAVFRVPRFDPPAVSAERLRDSVETLCSDFHPRSYIPPENLDRVADWIVEQLGDSGLEIREEPYSLMEGTYRNIIALRPGSEPDRGRVIIGAHYDAYGEMPGADDNASGVAVLLELIRTLPERPPRRTQMFALFVNEEPPFFSTPDMGSHQIARRLAEDGTAVELMIALDLVGYFSDEPGSQRFPTSVLKLFYPSRGDFIGVVGDTRAGQWIRTVKRGMRSAGTIPVYSFRAPTVVPGVDWSDHRPFRGLGMPGVLVTDTAMMRTPHYHRRTDTPDTLDYDRMGAVVQALHGVLADE